MKRDKRILVWTIILIAASFILTTCISVSSLNTVIEGHDEEMSKVLASNVYDSINNVLSEPIIVAKTMSNDYYLIGPLKEKEFPKKQRTGYTCFLSKYNKDKYGIQFSFYCFR